MFFLRVGDSGLVDQLNVRENTKALPNVSSKWCTGCGTKRLLRGGVMRWGARRFNYELSGAENHAATYFLFWLPRPIIIALFKLWKLIFILLIVNSFHCIWRFRHFQSVICQFLTRGGWPGLCRSPTTNELTLFSFFFFFLVGAKESDRKMDQWVRQAWQPPSSSIKSPSITGNLSYIL